jgi:hypothetical protein
MEIPIPGLASVETVWQWSKRSIEIWFQVLKDPSVILGTIDFGATESTIAALEFALFPVSLSITIELPIYLMTKDTTFGFAGYVVAKFVAYFGFVFIYALAQRISASVVARTKSMNACLITTLYAAAFWPIVVLTNYLVLPFKDLFPLKLNGGKVNFTGEQAVFVGVALIVGLIMNIYLLRKFIAMAKLTHRVGTARAFLISLGTIVIGTPLTLLFIVPFQVLFYGFSLF